MDRPANVMGAWERAQLTEARVGRLATVRPDGSPHLVPVTFALVSGEYGDALVFAVDAKPKRSTDLQRVRNLAANSSASLLVDHYEEDWARLWWIRVDASARTVGDQARRRELLSALADKYEQYRQQAPEGPVVLLDVRRVTSWTADSGS